MPGHRRAHLNEYPPEAQWGCPSEVVTLGLTTGARAQMCTLIARGNAEGAVHRCMCADGVSDGVSIYV